MPPRSSTRFKEGCAATGLLAILILAWGPASVRAESVALTPIADTFISEQYTNSNFGAMGYANVGTTENFTRHRALYTFDIAGAIPAGSTITSAQLILEVTRIPNNGYDVSDVGLHRMLRGWGEGDNNADKPSSAAPADLNESNWGYRFAGTSSTWGVPGGQEGVDYLAGASVIKQVLAVDGYEFGPTAALAQDLQFWLDNPGANFGWMAISQQENLQFTARRFGSREALPAYNVPRLLVDFIGAPEPSSAALVLGGSMVLYLLRRGRLRH